MASTEIDSDNDYNRKLADLLSASGLVEQKELEGSITVSKFMNLPLESILLKEGRIEKDLLKVVVRLSELLESGSLSNVIALMAIHDICNGLCDPYDTLNALDSFSNSARIGRLGEILVDANLVSVIAMGGAISRCKRSGKMLGTTLVELDLVSSPVLNLALKIQEKIRVKAMDYKKAVGLLQGTNSLAQAV